MNVSLSRISPTSITSGSSRTAPRGSLVSEVIALVTEAGGLEYARQRALLLAQEAEGTLDVLPPSPARDALRDSIAYAVERRS